MIENMLAHAINITPIQWIWCNFCTLALLYILFKIGARFHPSRRLISIIFSEIMAYLVIAEARARGVDGESFVYYLYGDNGLEIRRRLK